MHALIHYFSEFKETRSSCTRLMPFLKWYYIMLLSNVEMTMVLQITSYFTSTQQWIPEVVKILMRLVSAFTSQKGDFRWKTKKSVKKWKQEPGIECSCGSQSFVKENLLMDAIPKWSRFYWFPIVCSLKSKQRGTIYWALWHWWAKNLGRLDQDANPHTSQPMWKKQHSWHPGYATRGGVGWDKASITKRKSFTSTCNTGCK